MALALKLILALIFAVFISALFFFVFSFVNTMFILPMITAQATAWVMIPILFVIIIAFGMVSKAARCN